MYNININVSYDNVDLSSTSIQEGTTSDNLYRNQFLSVFNLTEFDDDLVVDKMDQLYESICNFSQFKEIFNILKTKISKRLPIDLSNRDLIVFLFSYDIFDTFHKTLTNFYSHEPTFIDDTYYNNLISKINELYGE
jgi:hypothetical protein